MSLACLRAMELATRVHSGVEEADRLRLDEHLASCARCAADAALLDGIVRTASNVEPLDGAARERVWRRALDARRTDKVVAEPARVGWRAAPFALAAVCLVALVALVGLRTRGRPEAGARLVAVARVFIVASADQPVRDQARSVELAAGETAELERATAMALRPSTLVWDTSSATARVSKGAVRFEVEPGRSKPFRVVTEKYTVEVLGTIFVVDDAEVSVQRGRVRVSTAGSPAREIGAGEVWRLGDATSSVDAPEPAPATSAKAASPGNVQILFARARKHLAAGQAKLARRLVEQALAQGLPPAQEAEAQTLLAECSLVSGDPKEAARRYEEVAKKHGDLPAGETALFAAGRSAHAGGQKAEARKLFQKYLARYPKGQFANEARARLSQLGS